MGHFKSVFKSISKDNNDFLEDYLKERIPRSFYRRALKRKVDRNDDIVTYSMSKEFREESKAFWKKRAGISISLIWHKAYAATSGIEDARYVPEDVFYKMIEPRLNDFRLYRAYQDKNQYSRLFANPKMPETVLVRVHGKFYDKDCEGLSYNKAISRFLEVGSRSKLVAKPSIDSGGGRKVQILDLRNLTQHESEREFTAILHSFSSDFLIQVFVKQDPLLNSVHPSSLNTLRITTLRLDNEIRILSSILRMGNCGNDRDNGALGGLSVGISDTGRLKGFATHHFTWKRYYRHPFTGFEFRGVEIPNWEGAKELVIRLHRSLLHFDLASWDIAIDEKGEPVLIEVNLKTQDINFHQRNNGPLFGEFTEQVVQFAIKKHDDS